MNKEREEPYIIDLHVHTLFSDGQYTPEDILKKAEERNLVGISFTDHDTVRAYDVHYTTSLTIIPGIEISSVYNGYPVHILGYSFNPKDESIQGVLQELIYRREQRNSEMVQKLQQAGFAITEAELQELSKGSYGRGHMALLMKEKGYVREPQEAFVKYIGENKPCYVAGKKFTPDEVIDAIHKANGYAVLAHPHLLFSKAIVEKLIPLGLDGLECYYGAAPLKENLHWEKIATDNGLLVSGGSDFHGEAMRPQAILGMVTAPAETFRVLLERAIANAD